MLMPPAQYDHPPQIPVIEKVLPWTEVQKLCAIPARRFHPELMNGSSLRFSVNGCEVDGIVWDNVARKLVPGKGCVIIRIDDEATRRHELAHCNGWPKDHPGGWYDARVH
jgi:hypothetical protein